VFPLLAAVLLAPPQGLDLEPAPPTPYDRVVELEITADDEPLIEGKGPTAIVEYQVAFNGWLHVWTQSELDLFLQVDDMEAFRTLASDDDSGGGTTPYVRIHVHGGHRLAVLVAGDPGVMGSSTLRIHATPETEETVAAAERALEDLERARELLGQGNRTSSRSLVNATVAALTNLSGAADSYLVVGALSALGPFAHDELGDFESSRYAWQMALRQRERTLPEDHPQLLGARSYLAGSMFALGDLAGARALEEAVLAAYERTLPEDHRDLLWTRANLARTMHVMGDLAGARALEEAVLAASERTLPKDHPDVLTARNNLGLSMQAMGDLVGARVLQEQVLEVYSRTLPEDQPSLLTARNNLAATMQAMGDLAGARALQEAVLAARERTLPEDHPKLLTARSNLAATMQAMGDFPGARALCEAALAARERTVPENDPGLLSARANLASSMYETGDFAGARALQEAVLATSERTLPEDHPDLLTARNNLAATIYAMGDLAGARALQKAVLTAYERTLPEDHPDLLTARNNLAATMYAMGDLASAHALLRELAAGMRARVLASLALAPRQALGTVESERERLAALLCWSDSAGPPLERSVFEVAETLRLVAGEAARSLSGFDKDPELAPLLVAATAVRKALNDLVAGAAREEASAGGLAAELTRLTLERDSLEREASRLLAERGVTARPVESAALAAALGNGEVAVGYRRLVPWYDCGERVIAHVLTSAGRLTRIDLGPAGELKELAGEWRAALGAPLLRGMGLVLAGGELERARGRALRARVLDPVLAAAGEGVSRLHVCADDLLFLVPLDALPLEEDEKGRVGDRFEIVNEVSFARILSGSIHADGVPSLLAFGGVDYDADGRVPDGLVASSAPIDEEVRADGVASETHETNRTRSALPDRFEKLLQSRYEAEATADLFEETFELDPVLLTRKETTKAALFEAAPGMRFLHLATHGWFAPESVKSIRDQPAGDVSFSRMSLEDRITGLAPMTLCGLALAGANNGRDSLGRVPGILTAEELCSLDLSQCELAVLSACETNVGIRRAGQGIQSLQAALYAAGARTSITSLWKVDDAATRRLFELFYTKLWKEKLGKADALWQAKMALRSEGHPVRDWAGWVLTGDPD
jgi:tetratricopeptide (TPR) repeat protein